MRVADSTAVAAVLLLLSFLYKAMRGLLVHWPHLPSYRHTLDVKPAQVN
jgi:hypothetical protein